MKIRQYSAPNVGDPAPKGTVENPYTIDEFLSFSLGEFPGGYVEGLGYVSSDAVVAPGVSNPEDPDYFPSSWGIPDPFPNDPSSSSSGSGSQEPLPGSQTHYNLDNYDEMDETNLWEYSGYNIPAAVMALTANAHSQSLGLSANYVRYAINAGGLPTPEHPIHAYQYKDYLPSLGFRSIAVNYLLNSFHAGDIIVIEPINNDDKGHIAMFNGEQWISDFRQNDIWGFPIYKTRYQQGLLNYTILSYRGE